MTQLNAIIKTAPNGAIGCDCNYPVTSKLAQAFKTEGYSFVIRYIPRFQGSNSGGDLSNSEADLILNTGLRLIAVQHVANEGWQPNAALGTNYGSYAATYCKNIDLPTGINIWLDLEGVNTSTSTDDVIAYCQESFKQVQAAGYIPGIYIGWQVIINNEQAYQNLSFSHYWKAYNADVTPAVRGYQMIQHTQKLVGGIEVDPNTVQTDAKGGLPLIARLKMADDNKGLNKVWVIIGAVGAVGGGIFLGIWYTAAYVTSSKSEAQINQQAIQDVRSRQEKYSDLQRKDESEIEALKDWRIKLTTIDSVKKADEIK